MHIDAYMYILYKNVFIQTYVWLHPVCECGKQFFLKDTNHHP